MGTFRDFFRVFRCGRCRTLSYALHPQFRLIGHILLRLGPQCMTSRELNTPHACHHAVCDVDTAARSQASFVPFQLPRRRRALLMGLSTRVGSSTAGSLLLASTGLFDSKMCCPAGPSPGSQVISLTSVRSSRGGASCPCPHLPSFGLPYGDMSSLRSSSRFNASSMLYAFPSVEAFWIYIPFHSGALTSRFPSHSSGISTSRPISPCCGVSTLRPTSPYSGVLCPHPVSPYSLGSNALGPAAAAAALSALLAARRR